MPETLAVRIALMEADQAEMKKSLAEMNNKLDEIMARGARMETEINNMAPSVEVVKEGLIFVRWGRRILVGLFIVITYFAGAFDWVISHIKLILRH
jgi:hypothetical protein